MSKKSKSDQSSPLLAAEQIGGNEDLIREILPYLPARSLIRFKAVSKQWFSLISDPEFGHFHTLRLNPSSFLPSGLFFYNPLTKSRQIESVSLSKTRAKIPSLLQIDLPSADYSIKLVQSCNGLDLFRIVSLPDRLVKVYCVRNSTTRQRKLIPLPNLTPFESNINCSLAFDPLKSPHYKVICVKQVLYQRCQIDIYSSETGNWRATNVTTNIPWRMEFENGVYWNGAIHWIREGFILQCYRFDIDAESLTTMSMPPKPQLGDRAYFRYFGEYNGHLHLVYMRSRGAKRFMVLEMDGVTLKWYVKYSVHLSRLVSLFPEIVQKGTDEDLGIEEAKYAFSILCVSRGEKEEDSALVLAIPGKVISYNFKSKESEVLAELPSQVVDISCFHYISAYPFAADIPRFHYISAYPFVATLYPL